jgi:hypothetical protein
MHHLNDRTPAAAWWLRCNLRTIEASQIPTGPELLIKSNLCFALHAREQPNHMVVNREIRQTPTAFALNG